ncbi:HflK protein [Solidesulfovibrio carbinoliphilus subsp. oakridgensis]|uniref:Protein HflK n=1 Tax=Solidesulfovibrio carbinoliphilus subsp. oakridgensis TaxID=694327 RepID=G7Q4X6_9BACT|nr:FtsH protease activity modulator HflK [Solidesulfovibrio carbinoliphilus]EHJ47903.1 HflK protein [Solidesulfovibrio carbinoliphilus subsp. oakridgensis]
MNWDWEKLTEQKRRQGSPLPDPGRVGEDWGRKLSTLKGRLPGGPKIVILVLAVFWLASGIYIVEPDEAGIVQRFGAYAYSTGPGPHYHLPFPVETVKTPKVSQVRRVEVGFHSNYGRDGASLQNKAVPEESLMLTGDENIVDVQFIVQYQVNNPVNYLFKIDHPDQTLKSAAEAAMREVMGDAKIDSVLTAGKLKVQTDAKALLQAMLNRYDSGMDVLAVQLQDVHPPREVVDAFKDVASAREDKVRLVNEADAYANDILPKARGRAAAILNEAAAYREQVIRRAKGGADRFSALRVEYEKAKDITRDRLYIEGMETLLSNPGLEKLVLSDDAARQAVPYLSLDALRQAPQVPAPENPAGRSEGQKADPAKAKGGKP